MQCKCRMRLLFKEASDLLEHFQRKKCSAGVTEKKMFPIFKKNIQFGKLCTIKKNHERFQLYIAEVHRQYISYTCKPIRI